jgi:type IV pilus biogenesis/stability protein PilW
MMRLRWLVLLLVALCVTVETGCIGAKREARSAIRTDLARAYLSEGNTEAAIGVLREAIKLNRRNTMAWNHMGVALMQKSRFDGAEEALERAVRLGGEQAEPHVNYGLLLMRLERYADAVVQFELALEDLTYRNQGLILNNLGWAHYHAGRFKDAERHLSNAVRRAPNLCPAHYNLGVVQKAQGNIDAALQTFEAAIGLCGVTASGAYLEAARILLEQGFNDRGLAYLRSVAEEHQTLTQQARKIATANGLPLDP